MACPSLEKHFEKLDQVIGDIDNLKRPKGRYSFIDPYAEKLRYTIKGSILATLGEGVEVPSNDLLGELRNRTYGPSVTSFYKIVNILRFLGVDTALGVHYMKGHLDDNWGPEYDKDRIFPRYYVDKIIKGEEVPLWVFELSKNLDVSYLSTRDKMRFLNRMIRSSELEARVAGMTHFNIGGFDYESKSLLELIDMEDKEYSLDKFEGEDDLDLTYFGTLKDIVGFMKSLRHLNLSNVMCRGRMLEVVEACPNKANIESLDLSYSGLTLPEFGRLDTIGLESLKDFRARRLRHSIQFAPDSHGYLTRLRRLDLSHNDILSGDMFLELLGNSTEMEELFLINSAIGGVESFKLNMPSLRLLDMTRATMFDGNDEDLIDLPELEDLRIAGMMGLSKRQTWEVPRLKHLRCTGREDLGIVAVDLTRYFPQLVSLDIESGGGDFFMSGVPLYNLSRVNLRYLSLPWAVDLQSRDYFRYTFFASIGTFDLLEAFGFGNDTNLLFETPEEGENPVMTLLPNLIELDCRWTGSLPTCIDQEVGVSNMSLEYFGLDLPEEESIYPVPVPDTLRVFRSRDVASANSTCIFLDNVDRASFLSDDLKDVLKDPNSRIQGYVTRDGLYPGDASRLRRLMSGLQYVSHQVASGEEVAGVIGLLALVQRGSEESEALLDEAGEMGDDVLEEEEEE